MRPTLKTIRLMMRTSLIVLGAGMATATTIPLVTFDGAAGTTHKFTELNDPVMGGRSTGTWSEAEAWPRLTAR